MNDHGHDDYAPSTASRAARRQRSDRDSTAASSAQRPGLGTRRMSNSNARQDYFPQSDAQLPSLGTKGINSTDNTKSSDPGTTSRIRAGADGLTHICSPCRHLFRAHARPLRGIALLLAAMGILAWCFTSSIMAASTFWMIVTCLASFICVCIGSRQFYIFDHCPQCGSDRTSRLDTAHGRQIQTETIMKSDTSYMRKKI